jgi:hypothetical protein
VLKVSGGHLPEVEARRQSLGKIFETSVIGAMLRPGDGLAQI